MESREIRLVKRPVGMPQASDFEEATVAVLAPGPGEVTVRNLFMGVDPAMRGRMSDAKSYVPPFELGVAMEGSSIGEVIASQADGFKPGDLVFHRLGWREAFTASAESLSLRDGSRLPPEAWLHAAGMTGLTAYVGLMRIAEIRPGDVIFVSAAAGAVGSLVCQIAKLKGHKVIGAAGGERKAAYLRDELKLDGVVDYKAEANLTKAVVREMRAIGAEGIDVYFDNVGGDHLQAALATANPHARFAICGMISQYNTMDRPDVPRNLTMLMVKKIRMQGYIVLDHQDLEPYLIADMTAWHMAGLIKPAVTISEGIDNALDAFFGLFRGDNLGRSLVRLGEPSPNAAIARV